MVKVKASKKKKKKKKLSVRLLVKFIIFEILFTGLSSAMFVFYGPFDNVRNMVVATADKTMHFRFVPHLFLSSNRISEILSSQRVLTASAGKNQDLSEISIEDRDDKGIDKIEFDGGKYKGYLLIVHDPTRIKVGVTNKLYKQGERTSDIARDNNAAAAINGGGFTDKSADGKLFAGTGSIPTGFVISNGKVICNDSSDTSYSDVCAIDAQGRLIVGSHNVNELKKMNIKEAITFGPTLIKNGDRTFKGNGAEGKQPRTAIGQKKNGEMILLVIDGRSLTMSGTTLAEVQDIMLKYGAVNAVELDGGSSSTMYYNGEVINTPCNPLGERTVATAIYVTP